MKRMVSTTAVISLILSSTQPSLLWAQDATCTPDDSACITAQGQAAAPNEEVSPELAPELSPELTPEAAPETQPEPQPAPEGDQTPPQAPQDDSPKQSAPEPSPPTDAAPEPEVVPEPEVAPPEAAPSAEPLPEPTPDSPAQPQPTAEPAAEAEQAPPAEQLSPEPSAPPVSQPAPESAPETAAQTAAQTGPTEAQPQPPSPEELAQMQAVEKAAQEAALAAKALDQEKAKAAQEAPPIEAPVVSKAEAESLQNLIAPPAEGAEPSQAARAAAAAADTPPAGVVETIITPADARSSAQEFAPAPEVVSAGKKSGLSDLEKAGLVALGALALGTMMSSGQEVVSNSGDRVVLRDQNGAYQIYKDDDTLLRRPGSALRSETYDDGSSRTVVTRDDGITVVTLRDGSGRVLQRSQIDRNGQQRILINDLRQQDRVDINALPKPTAQTKARGDAALAAALARQEAQALGRSFSLRQIRDIPELRRLAMTIDVDNITFATGSSIIRPSEAPKLASLGRALQGILAQNPSEVFLIEGHTDAVGSDYSNLTLSDRRAESVALALTEYYRIPPENMVVQGYGEAELRIPTQAAEPRNRRAAVRMISPLMQLHD